MLPGAGTAITRAAAVIPVVLIVLFIGLLWLLGLMCGGERRRYVTDLSQQAMEALEAWLRGPALPTQIPRASRRPKKPQLKSIDGGEAEGDRPA
jgi:hypothetical protein